MFSVHTIYDNIHIIKCLHVSLYGSGIFALLPAGNKLICDGGFKGEPQHIATPFPRRNITAQQREFNKLVSSQRWRVESTFSRLERWMALEATYRHSLEKHWQLWTTAVTLYNMDVLVHPLSKNWLLFELLHSSLLSFLGTVFFGNRRQRLIALNRVNRG